jgi:hypothetical protein
VQSFQYGEAKQRKRKYIYKKRLKIFWRRLRDKVSYSLSSGNEIFLVKKYQWLVAGFADAK